MNDGTTCTRIGQGNGFGMGVQRLLGISGCFSTGTKNAVQATELPEKASVGGDTSVVLNRLNGFY